jgi:hypothetical protein
MKIIHSIMRFGVGRDERRQIVAAASEAGLTIASYLRKKTVPKPQTPPVFQQTGTRHLIKDLIRHIGRLTSLMNQIVYKLSSDVALTQLDHKLIEEGVSTLKDIRSMLVTYLLRRRPC